MPGRGRAPLRPVPRQAARQDDDGDRRSACRTGGTRCRTARSSRRTTPKTGAWRFHWKMDEPHPSYLAHARRGRVRRDRADGGASRRPGRAARVPRPEGARGGRPAHVRAHARDGRALRRRSPASPYPWNRYAQVVVSDFIFGGMENTTATTMYEHILLDARAALDVTMRRPHRARARAPVVRRLRHVPRLVARDGSTRASRRSSSTSGARSTSGATSTTTA